MIVVNLLPNEVREKNKLRDWIILGYSLNIFLFLLAGSWYFVSLDAYQNNLHKKEIWMQHLLSIKSKVIKVEELDQKQKVLNAKRNTVLQLLQRRLLYPKLMETFYRSLPNDIWVTNLSFSQTPENNILLTAQSKSVSMPAIADWVQVLQSDTVHFAQVNISAIEVEKKEDNTTYNFTLTFVVLPEPGNG